MLPTSRRTFLQQTGLVFPLLWSTRYLPFNTTALSANALRFGLVADAHQDIIHDAEKRLAPFIQQSITLEVDFNLQLGDFCMAKEKTAPFFNSGINIRAPNTTS